MSMRLRWVLPILKYQEYGRVMKTIDQALGFDQSEVAQFRLRCITILNQQGYAGVTLAFPQVSRRSVYRWQKAYEASNKQLSSLYPRSTKPHTVNQMHVPAQVLSFLKAIRVQHPHLSKYKLKPLLDEWCQEQQLPSYSVSWIGKVLNRYQLFFATRKKVQKRRRTSRSGYIIKRTPNPASVKLGYLQVDGVKVYWLGEKVLFLTALELKTRKAWVRVVPTISSYQAKLFLETIMDSLSFPLHTIHTDNGSEFHAYFDRAVTDLELTHLWSPPRTPKVHAHLERFNGVFQEEFVDYHIDTALIEPEEFQVKLHDWLWWYNQKRPHHSLQLKSPEQYLVDLQKG